MRDDDLFATQKLAQLILAATVTTPTETDAAPASAPEPGSGGSPGVDVTAPVTVLPGTAQPAGVGELPVNASPVAAPPVDALPVVVTAVQTTVADATAAAAAATAPADPAKVMPASAIPTGDSSPVQAPTVDDSAPATTSTSPEPAAAVSAGTTTAPSAQVASGATSELRLTTESVGSTTAPRTVPEPPAAQLTQLLAPVLEGPDGAHTLSLQLYPKELGAVQVEVMLRAGEISLALHAARDTSLDVLRAALPDLRAQLEQAGLTAGSLTVDGERPTPQQGQRESDHRSPARQQPAHSPLTTSDVPAGRLDLNAPLDLRM